MKPEDFSLSNFNNTMQADIANQRLDFCKALILSPKKISLTLDYAPDLFSKRYAALNQDLTTCCKEDFSGYYYGASPKIDSFSIIDAISALSFQSQEHLDAYLSHHCREFMLHEDQAEFLPHVARLILLTAASKYGIKLKSCPQLHFLHAQESPFSAIVSYREAEGILLLSGCPYKELLQLLAPYRFVKNKGLWEVSPEGLSLAEIYAEKSNIQLLSGKVFYSGVLLRPLALHQQQYNFENSGISNYRLLYERSSFATVCAFDDCFLDHPLLKESRPSLEQFFRYDDSCKLRLSQALSQKDLADQQILSAVNRYIKESYNVNQIGISSNLKTPKGEILFGLRASENIDDGFLYPSVNGNAEIYDETVSFYNSSVYEDLPTVHLHQKRSDLLGEIAREAYGELNLISVKESWSCHGMILLGNLPKEGQHQPGRRRCHFSVLFENTTEENLEEIKVRYRKASESFENKNFAAVSVRYYRTRLHGFFGGLLQFLRRVLKSKDVIESLLLLLVAFISMQTITLSFQNLPSLLSLVFAGILLLTTLAKAVQWALTRLRNARSTKVLRIYGTMSYASLCCKLSKVMTMDYHPAAYASLKMHIENLVQNDLLDQ